MRQERGDIFSVISSSISHPSLFRIVQIPPDIAKDALGRFGTVSPDGTITIHGDVRTDIETAKVRKAKMRKIVLLVSCWLEMDLLFLIVLLQRDL